MRRVVVLFFTATLMSACTMIDRTPAGEKVRVLSADEVTKCERLGSTTVSVLAKIAGLNRMPEAVQEDLNDLARNSAADLKGDTVSPVTPVTDGRQTFGVYRCMPQ